MFMFAKDSIKGSIRGILLVQVKQEKHFIWRWPGKRGLQKNLAQTKKSEIKYKKNEILTKLKTKAVDLETSIYVTFIYILID